MKKYNELSSEAKYIIESLEIIHEMLTISIEGVEEAFEGILMSIKDYGKEIKEELEEYKEFDFLMSYVEYRLGYLELDNVVEYEQKLNLLFEGVC